LAVDYDLVIIGATVAAQVAAIEAVNQRARVALVLPQSISFNPHPYRDLYPQALAQIAKTNRPDRSRLQQPSNYPWKYALAAIDRLDQQHSPALLAAMGVDTIAGMGEFCRRPQLGFQIDGRLLRGKTYLVATGSIPYYPNIPGLQEIGYLSADRLTDLVDYPIPRRWAIIGDETIGVELAQTLARLGCQVTLIVSTETILPYEDPEFASQLQAQLEADGVQIYLETVVTAIDRDQDSKLIMLGSEVIAVDEILIALPDRPLIEPFNLGGVGVDYNDKGISVDKKMQTSNRRIYACGSVCGNVLGGYRSDGLTNYEARIAVGNALSRCKTKVDYSRYDRFPWAVHTDPPLARVGLTASSATNSHHRDIIILEQYFKNCTQAVLSNASSGWCQIITTQTGQILGATIVGQNAPELIQVLTLAIQSRLKITDLIACPSLSPSYSEIIDLTAAQWHIHHRRHQSQRPSWLRRLWNR
jgi:pyruvate/2-oxoglutarate dehydrogenase complex dihydrolipoamide dehydrogenase (E3) component